MKTMTDQEQCDALFELQRMSDHDLERELWEAEISRIVPFQGGGHHVTEMFEVILETARAGYWKPHSGLASSRFGAIALANYGHEPTSAMLAECAAWQLAKAIGPPWSEMVAPVVLKGARPPGRQLDVGTLSIHRHGRDKTRGFIAELPDAANAGAFFDCLIGQQDRNEGNVLWNVAGRALYLIDHAFSFAKPGNQHGELLLWSWRWVQGAKELSQSELDVLGTLEGAALEDRVATFLDPERLAALRNRAHRMRSTGLILPPGAY